MKTLLLCICLATIALAEEPKILFEQDSTLLVSHFSVVIQTGSKDDSRDKVGLANLMAELVLRGTKKKDRSKFQLELEKMGATLNVHTGQDMIVFDGKVIKENTLDFLALMHEAIVTPALSKKEFEDLKREIADEISHMKNANNRLGGLTARRELFAGSALETTVMGRLKTLSKITHDDVVRAYNDRFHRANILFGVSSSLSEGALKQPITKMWLSFPDGAKSASRVVKPQEPVAPKIIVIHKAKTSTGAMIIAQGGITAQDPDRYALMLGNFSFGSEPLVSRLFRIIRGELGWTYAIGTTYNATGTLGYQPGMYIISSTPSVEFSAKTLFKSLEMWREYLSQGLDSEELTLAQDSMVNSYPFDFDSPEKRLSQRMYSYINNVPILSSEEFEKTIRKIDNGVIKKALKERHNGNGLVIAIVADKDVVEKQLADEQKSIPEEKRLKIAKVVTPEEVVE